MRHYLKLDIFRKFNRWDLIIDKEEADDNQLPEIINKIQSLRDHLVDGLGNEVEETWNAVGYMGYQKMTMPDGCQQVTLRFCHGEEERKTMEAILEPFGFTMVPW